MLRRALLCVLRVGKGKKEEERRRKKEKGKGKKEKGKKEKGKKRRERKRELSAGFAAAVGDARAVVFGRLATSMRNERKGKGIGRRLVLVSGRRIAGI